MYRTGEIPRDVADALDTAGLTEIKGLACKWEKWETACQPGRRGYMMGPWGV
jgi:hypothetical protein